MAASLLLAATGPAYGSEPVPPYGACVGVAVPAGYTCVDSPKQCFTTPCPQYDLVPGHDSGESGDVGDGTGVGWHGAQAAFLSR